jgi:hypothetical protein
MTHSWDVIGTRESNRSLFSTRPPVKSSRTRSRGRRARSSRATSGQNSGTRLIPSRPVPATWDHVDQRREDVVPHRRDLRLVIDNKTRPARNPALVPVNSVVLQ